MKFAIGDVVRARGYCVTRAITTTITTNGGGQLWHIHDNECCHCLSNDLFQVVWVGTADIKVAPLTKNPTIHAYYWVSLIYPKDIKLEILSALELLALEA